MTAGKISRRVSFVNYLEASEVPKDDTKKLKLFNERSSATTLTNSGYNFAIPTKSTKPGSGRTSTHTSGHKSSLSEEKTRTKKLKPSRSTQDSDHGSEHSGEKKKKRKKDVA